nr:MAG TPA: hypothetical protein [Caudoviricetes sp.]
MRQNCDIRKFATRLRHKIVVNFDQINVLQ